MCESVRYILMWQVLECHAVCFDTLVTPLPGKLLPPGSSTNIAKNVVLPTKVHGVTSQMTIFTQNINRDTVYGHGATKDKRREAAETRTLEPLAQFRKQGQQTNVGWTDAQDQARNVSRTNLVLMQPVRGHQCRNHAVHKRKKNIRSVALVFKSWTQNESKFCTLV
jgi:hypothetical protein